MKTLQALLDSEVADVIGPGHRCRTFPAIFEYSDTVSTVLERLGANESVEEQLYGLVLRKSAPAPPARSSASRETWSRGPVVIKDVLGFIDLSIILQTALRSACFRCPKLSSSFLGLLAQHWRRIAFPYSRLDIHILF